MEKYGIPLEISECFSPPDINAKFYLSKKLDKSQQEKIKGLILSWYDVGFYGGYDDEFFLNYLGNIAFDKGNIIFISVDFGNSTEKPLDVLIKILKTALEQYDTEITKIEL